MGHCVVRSAVLALALCGAPAMAQALPGSVAAPGSPEYNVGDAVLYFVGGRTLEDVGGAAFNPFSIDGDSLLFSAGAFFVVTEYDGPLHEGELAIYPQYQMPRGVGTPSAEMPPIVPFAMLQGGKCYGGYVAGFPVLDTTYAVDMTDMDCHADAVEQLVADSYVMAAEAEEHPPEEPMEQVTPTGFNPAFPTDGALSDAVYYAYDAAYTQAVSNPDYFFWDGSNFAKLRDAIVAALALHDLGAIDVISDPLSEASSTKTCAPEGRTVLNIALTPDKLGIAITAASSQRYYSYEYDSALSADIRITEARDCATSGPGRAHSRSN